MINPRDRIWRAMLNSHMNQLYYRYLAVRYTRTDQATQVVAAVLASRAIASLQLWKRSSGWFQWSLAWDFLSAAAVFSTISVQFFRVSDKALRAKELAGVFMEYTKRYGDLWARTEELTDELLRDRFETLEASELAVTNDSDMPRNTKLILKCQNEVLRSRGLPEITRRGE